MLIVIQVDSASRATPSLPHAVPQFHHFAVRRRLVEGLDSVLFYSRAVLGRVLQMMPFNL